MNYEELVERIENVKTLEKNMLRELTPEEKEYVLENGIKDFITNYLEFDKDDDFTFKRIKTLISAFCTDSYEAFETELDKDNGNAIPVLKTIVNALEDAATRKAMSEVKDAPEHKCNVGLDLSRALELFPSLAPLFKKNNMEVDKCEKFDRVTECEGNCEKCDWITYLIERLKEGEELELSDEEIEAVSDKILATERNVRIKVINNKMSAKFLS